MAKLLVGTGVVTVGLAIIKFVVIDLPEGLPVKGESNFLQRLYHLHYKYGFEINNALIHNKFSHVKQAIGSKKAKAAVHEHLGNSKELTLAVLDKVVQNKNMQKT